MTELNGLNHVGDELLRMAELEYVSRKHATFAENERNRLATNTAFGMEAYETLPGGERRYLGVDEVARTVRFTKGKFVIGDPGPTLPSGYSSARTALSRIPALLNAFPVVPMRDDWAEVTL